MDYMAGYSQQRLANYCEPKLNDHQFFFAVEWSSCVASVSPHQTCHKFLLPCRFPRNVTL